MIADPAEAEKTRLGFAMRQILCDHAAWVRERQLSFRESDAMLKADSPGPWRDSNRIATSSLSHNTLKPYNEPYEYRAPSTLTHETGTNLARPLFGNKDSELVAFAHSRPNGRREYWENAWLRSQECLGVNPGPPGNYGSPIFLSAITSRKRSG